MKYLFNGRIVEVEITPSNYIMTAIDSHKLPKPVWISRYWMSETSSFIEMLPRWSDLGQLNKHQKKMLGLWNYSKKRDILSILSGIESSSTHAIGDGEWSIELHCADGRTVEFVGSNGTRYGEQPSDLYAIIAEYKTLAERYQKFIK